MQLLPSRARPLRSSQSPKRLSTRPPVRLPTFPHVYLSACLPVRLSAGSCGQSGLGWLPQGPEGTPPEKHCAAFPSASCPLFPPYAHAQCSFTPPPFEPGKSFGGGGVRGRSVSGNSNLTHPPGAVGRNVLPGSDTPPPCLRTGLVAATVCVNAGCALALAAAVGRRIPALRSKKPQPASALLCFTGEFLPAKTFHTHSKRSP